MKWMRDAKTNLSYNCLDRHLEKSGGKTAFFWEGNDPRDEGKITYAEMHKEVRVCIDFSPSYAHIRSELKSFNATE